MSALASVLDLHRILICAGSGGVGKTTTAAALALLAARQGHRTVVLTIDPARRLADALGLKEMGNEAVTVPDGEGRLWAIMLDQKGAWDALVTRHAPNDEIRRRILENRFYQHLSQSFAGSQEYMAIEQLAELHESGRYDRIVVDTPPSRHALDFLEAPRRIADFLDRDVIRWFVRPYFSAGWGTWRLLNRTAGSVLRRLEEATGVSVLVEVSDFFTAMGELFEGFEDRVRRVENTLRSPHTAFVLVASADEHVLAEARAFYRRVEELGVGLRAVIFNRVHSATDMGNRPGDEKRLREWLRREVPNPRTAARLAENFLRYERLARGDTQRIRDFVATLASDLAIATVPNFDRDLHDVRDLERILPYLSSPEPP